MCQEGGDAGQGDGGVGGLAFLDEARKLLDLGAQAHRLAAAGLLATPAEEDVPKKHVTEQDLYKHP